jgi:hypothetical protein
MNHIANSGSVTESGVPQMPGVHRNQK